MHYLFKIMVVSRGGGLGYWYSRRTIGIRMNLGNESTQPASINESNFTVLFSLYPNPSNGILQLMFNHLMKMNIF